jgi:hypothetical protein
MNYRTPSQKTLHQQRIVKKVGLVSFLGILFIFFAMIAAWITHVIVCLKLGLWGFLIAGALVFPIAIIHGIGIWFGLW